VQSAAPYSGKAVHPQTAIKRAKDIVHVINRAGYGIELKSMQAKQAIESIRKICPASLDKGEAVKAQAYVRIIKQDLRDQANKAGVNFESMDKREQARWSKLEGLTHHAREIQHLKLDSSLAR